MPDKNLIKLKYKNYLSFIAKMPGSTMWQNVWVKDSNGKEFDVAEGGGKSCAYVTSSVLTIFKLLDEPHLTVETTSEKMIEHGWVKTDKPAAGSVIEWDGHNGFYLSDDFVVSNSTEQRQVIRHGLVMSDGRKPVAYYFHPELVDN